MNNFSNNEGPNGKNSFKFEKGQISIINISKIFDTVNKKNTIYAIYIFKVVQKKTQ